MTGQDAGVPLRRHCRRAVPKKYLICKQVRAYKCEGGRIYADYRGRVVDKGIIG